ncbi:hypothetical protein CNMCM5623_006999 [Aspergillus felis]|uniref:Transcription factor domain-containing protein n=1 Tax=Aspergillus felis TaxID=1287682 RepID=A0A8H6PUK6_9EURO|nr:hypothetical protein CNMCM5623_006999 [Aspergillus felis]
MRKAASLCCPPLSEERMNYVFINVKKPRDALKRAKEREFRSHVTRQQWKRSGPRKKAILATEENSARDQVDTDSSSDKISISSAIGGLRVDPFQSYPIPSRPWTAKLVDHYLVHMAVDIPELDQPGNRGLLRTSWFPLVMTEPALFWVVMLLAASHYASHQAHPGSIRIDLLGLRCQAISLINQRLEDRRPEDIDDALIGAIAKMASYEAMFGSFENYTVHMQGLVGAISLRGGLATLGLNGLLYRIVVWIDRNAAFLHGSGTYYFPGATFVPDGSLPDPNPGHFLGGS